MLSFLVNIDLGADRAPSKPVNIWLHNAGSGSTSVLSDAPLRLDVEEGDGRWRRGKHCAEAREYGSPLLPVLRVDPV